MYYYVSYQPTFFDFAGKYYNVMYSTPMVVGATLKKRGK